ncbi:LOW QUALITY PROTEIN: hypothetical protein FGSG_12305 [Fusarium graminearum PH-1]|uniref:hypothetical protein n=1 Tax=Gibberella zeae (strain ATCC MYA-4620 / CBS 123657 / FGSC 9075 / NRRL 31084 / PH-1) TaxID=229533 RepID=UPI00021F1E9C|nr:LOW QUALITY PROTEIN: hypothetical protein FGSG_12305 [Fusarium graminearum PH-1]ESU09040.1 LOW QUALITY PROTEIN: hypothetical protein FGSG_12305 [Fusarium graminearum PH-1]|eukprot:XP_011321539.1 LOW QUALITY PROTEIN: hypothetical protein FGSG_12305 [Fusarium graminearum PH-1]
MPILSTWHLVPRGDHGSSPESDDSSTAGATGNIVPSNAFADDLFREKFMGIAKGGSNGEKIMRGFLIGLAIGLLHASFVVGTHAADHEYETVGDKDNGRAEDLL